MFEDIFKKIKVWSEKSIIDEVIIIAILIALCESLAQNFIKSSDSNLHINMFFGLSFYIIVGFLLHHAYNNYALSKVNVTWSCLSIILATVLGYIVYNENITQNNIISVIAAIIAVYFAS
jgi:multidrug transporter EmrE-like cation transporter